MSFALINKIRTNTLFRNGTLFAFFSFLNSGIGFLLLLVLASFIPPSEYGELNLFNTFVTLLSIFISLNATGIIAVDFFFCGENATSADVKYGFMLVFRFISYFFITALVLFRFF